MMAAEDPEELSADEIAAELREAGIVPTLSNLKALCAAARATSHNEIETDRRHRPHPLVGLTPAGMSLDTPRKWAGKTLDAWRVQGRWFSTISAMERWLIEGDRLTPDALKTWRETMLRRFP